MSLVSSILTHYFTGDGSDEVVDLMTLDDSLLIQYFVNMYSAFSMNIH